MAKPARHGQIKTSTWKVEHAKKHLSSITASMNEVKDYGSHGDIGQSSCGGFTGSGMSGGAAGADYETESVGDTPDADSQGPTGY